MTPTIFPKRSPLLLLVIISALIVLAACGRNRTPEPTPTVAPTEAPTVAPTATPVPPPTATPIPAPTLGDGGTWTLQSLNGANVPAPNLVTATFAENGLLTGISGCNNYSAGYIIDGDTIAIEPPATTRKACSDARMMLEEEYLAALTAAATFSVDGATLTLFDGDDAEVATLLAGAASLQNDSTWNLVAYRRPDGTLLPVDRTLPISVTVSTGALHGVTPCREFSASLELGTATATVGAVDETPLDPQPAACQDRGLAAVQDADFLAALGSVSGYELTADALTLLDAAGNPVALLIPPEGAADAALEAAAAAAAAVTPTATAEEATPSASEAATPAADEEATPVAEEEATPVADEEATPATEEEATPVANEEATPVTEEEATPMADEEATPVAAEEPTAEEAAAAAAALEALRAENPLAMTAWTLDHFGSAAESVAPLDGTSPGVLFLPEEFVGTGGCNWFAGAYSVVDSEIVPTNPNITRTECDSPAGVMEQEDTFVGALANATAYAVGADNLVLSTVGDQELMTLVPHTATPPTTTAGVETTWTLAMLRMDDEWVPAAGDVTLRLKDEEVSGFGGCNNFFGAVAQTGDAVDFSGMGSTRKMCPDGDVMDQEAAFLQTLESVDGGIAFGDAWLLTTEGQGALLLVAAE